MKKGDTQLPDIINGVIRGRRSVFPNMYLDKEIPESILEEILENARWAPTHKLTQPWRFKIFRGKGLESLSAYLGDYYKKHNQGDGFSQKKFEKTIKKPLQSACVIAVCMKRDPKERIPEFEEIAAVSCAVQNIWLSAWSYGIGGYWSTSTAILEADDFLALEEGEQCLGLFYMGYFTPVDLPTKRDPISDKIVWRNT